MHSPGECSHWWHSHRKRRRVPFVILRYYAFVNINEYLRPLVDPYSLRAGQVVLMLCTKAIFCGIKIAETMIGIALKMPRWQGHFYLYNTYWIKSQDSFSVICNIFFPKHPKHSTKCLKCCRNFVWIALQDGIPEHTDWVARSVCDKQTIHVDFGISLC